MFDPQAGFAMIALSLLLISVATAQLFARAALSTAEEDRALREGQLWSFAYSLQRDASGDRL